jgi:hypothetical protein
MAVSKGKQNLGPLAIYTDFASPSPKINADGVVQDGFERRFLRWELQNAARQLLGTKHRIGVCHRVPSSRIVDGQPRGAKVYRRLKDSATYYRGLMVCANFWTCFICSAKIAERRRVELEEALDCHLGKGGGVYHMLLTLPHTRRDKPGPLVKLLTDTFRRLCSGKGRLGEVIPGFMGIVRALEPTYGDNGWHPHLHVLVFTEAVLSDKEIALIDSKVFTRWDARVLKVTGKHASRKAFSFSSAKRGMQEGSLDAVSDYLSKFAADGELRKIVSERRTWGAADELTKAHLKTKGRGGRSPWQLLADYQAGDTASGMLWKEFVDAFKGLPALRWSRGLRNRLGIGEEKTDEQLAEAVEAEDILLALIPNKDWDVIIKNNLRALVLEILRIGSWQDVQMMLERHSESGIRDDSG